MKDEVTTPIKQNSVFVPFLVGGIVGAAIGLLLAPKPGREVRKQIRDMASDTKEKLSSAVGKSREVYDEARAAISSAVDAGRHAYAEEREKFQTSH